MCRAQQKKKSTNFSNFVQSVIKKTNNKPDLSSANESPSSKFYEYAQRQRPIKTSITIQQTTSDKLIKYFWVSKFTQSSHFIPHRKRFLDRHKKCLLNCLSRLEFHLWAHLKSLLRQTKIDRNLLLFCDGKKPFQTAGYKSKHSKRFTSLLNGIKIKFFFKV